jgi:hypothetical protein
MTVTFINGLRQCLKNWQEPFMGSGVAAHHKAVTFSKTPDTTARAHIKKEDAFSGQNLSAAHTILVIGVASVNDDIIEGETAHQGVDSGFSSFSGGHHHPYGAGFAQPRHLLFDGSDPGSSLFDNMLHGLS